MLRQSDSYEDGRENDYNQPGGATRASKSVRFSAIAVIHLAVNGRFSRPAPLELLICLQRAA
jgi:hypothetical protein